MCIEIQEQGLITPEEELRIKVLGFTPLDVVARFLPDCYGLVDRNFDTNSIIGVSKRLTHSKVWDYDADFILEPYFKLVVEQDFEVVCYFLKTFMLCSNEKQKKMMFRLASITGFFSRRQNELMAWVEKNEDYFKNHDFVKEIALH